MSRNPVKGGAIARFIKALETSASMVYRVRKQLVEEGFEGGEAAMQTFGRGANPGCGLSPTGQDEDRPPTRGYEPTREAAMAAFAKSWRRV
jgi:hypothetical protein